MFDHDMNAKTAKVAEALDADGDNDGQVRTTTNEIWAGSKVVRTSRRTTMSGA